jgi:hypothetical protein
MTRALAILAGAVVLFAVLTSKTGFQDTLLLNGLKYRITRYADRVDMFREDGLRFTYSLRTGKTTLHAGTQAQLRDALTELSKHFTSSLDAAAEAARATEAQP